MEKTMNKSQKKQILSEKIASSLDGYYFDIQSISSSTPIDESQLIKLVTKFTVAAATVWWTALEIKDHIKLKRMDSKIEESLNDILSGKDSDFNSSY
jgi:hypothetical protein